MVYKASYKHLITEKQLIEYQKIYRNEEMEIRCALRLLR